MSFMLVSLLKMYEKHTFAIYIQDRPLFHPKKIADRQVSNAQAKLGPSAKMDTSE